MAFLQVSFKNCPATTPELEDFGMSMGDWGVCLRSLLGVFGFLLVYSFIYEKSIFACKATLYLWNLWYLSICLSISL